MRDEVRHCPACEATTAHQRRGAPWPTIVGGALSVVGVLMSAGGPLLWPTSLPMALVGVNLVVRDRQARWDIACGRCRAKAVALGRWAWLHTTEVHLS